MPGRGLSVKEAVGRELEPELSAVSSSRVMTQPGSAARLSDCLMYNTSRVSIASLEPNCVLPYQQAPSPSLPLSASHPAWESFVTHTIQKPFSPASHYLLGASPQPGVHGPLAVTSRLSSHVSPHDSQSTHTHTPPTGAHLDRSMFHMF